jgi:hypothetical protein
MNRNDVDNFEKIFGQLNGVYEEISLLSKKNPNDAVNKFKLKFINKLIADSNDFLTDKYRPFDDFDSFDEDDIPQNGDVVFILSQYLQCFEKLRADNTAIEYGKWYWQVKEDKTEGNGDTNKIVSIQTIKPKNLRD